MQADYIVASRYPVLKSLHNANFMQAHSIPIDYILKICIWNFGENYRPCGTSYNFVRPISEGVKTSRLYSHI
jgi:hypothetical protein